jgi:hypothetical protein
VFRQQPGVVQRHEAPDDHPGFAGEALLRDPQAVFLAPDDGYIGSGIEVKFRNPGWIGFRIWEATQDSTYGLDLKRHGSRDKGGHSISRHSRTALGVGRAYGSTRAGA